MLEMCGRMKCVLVRCVCLVCQVHEDDRLVAVDGVVVRGMTPQEVCCLNCTVLCRTRCMCVDALCMHTRIDQHQKFYVVSWIHIYTRLCMDRHTKSCLYSRANVILCADAHMCMQGYAKLCQSFFMYLYLHKTPRAITLPMCII